MKNKLNISALLFLLLFSCSKSDYDLEPQKKGTTFINIIHDTIVFRYPEGQPSSYVFVDYESDSLRRVFWTSPDSFPSTAFGWTQMEPIAGMSTYTREDGTAQQGVYIMPEFIGRTLKVVAFTDEITLNNARDSIFIKVQ